jgi:hypothetical protein
VIGERAEPLRISGPQMVEIVRDELVTDLPPVTIPIAEVPVFSTIKQVLWWTTLIPGILAVLAIGFAFFARPERRDLQIFATSMMFGLALSIGVFAVVIPMWGLPALSDTTWIVGYHAARSRTLLLVDPGAMVIFIGLGHRESDHHRFGPAAAQPMGLANLFGPLRVRSQLVPLSADRSGGQLVN